MISSISGIASRAGKAHKSSQLTVRISAMKSPLTG